MQTNNTCVYHSLQSGGMTIAILGNCKECNASTSCPPIIRCKRCSTNTNQCMKCDESLDFSVEQAKTAIEKLKEKELRYGFLKTPENQKAFDDFAQALQDGKYTTFENLKTDYKIFRDSLETQICNHMRKSMNL